MFSSKTCTMNGVICSGCVTVSNDDILIWVVVIIEVETNECRLARVSATLVSEVCRG